MQIKYKYVTEFKKKKDSQEVEQEDKGKWERKIRLENQFIWFGICNKSLEREKKKTPEIFQNLKDGLSDGKSSLRTQWHQCIITKFQNGEDKDKAL